MAKKPYFLEWLNNFATDCLREQNFQRYITRTVFVPRSSNIVSIWNLTVSVRQQTAKAVIQDLPCLGAFEKTVFCIDIVSIFCFMPWRSSQCQGKWRHNKFRLTPKK